MIDNQENTAGAEAALVRDHNLRIESRPIAELKAAGRKARHHPAKQIAKIADSIRRFGFVSPVLIDSEGRILAGLARLEAAKSLAMTSLPTVVVDHLQPRTNSGPSCSLDHRHGRTR